MLAALLLALMPQTAASESPTAVFVPARSQKAGPRGEELEAFLDPLFAEWLERLRIPGAVLVVVSADEVLLQKGYGFTDKSRSVAVDPERTLFRVASVSKSFTATALVQLHERGEVDLFGDVNEFVSGVSVPDTFPEPITLGSLLTHSAGFDEFRIGTDARTEKGQPELVTYTRERMPARVRPRDELSCYSNYGFCLAGLVIEELGGRPFVEYMEGNLLGPLGMTRSAFALRPEMEVELATGHALEGKRVVSRPYDYLKDFPAGSLIATGADMARYARFHLGDGELDGQRLLGAEAARLMHAQQFTNHPGLPGWTFGFQERRYGELRALEHTGDWGGFSSLLFLLPDEDVGFFLSANLQGGTLRRQLVDRFLERFFPEKSGMDGEDDEPPAPAKRRGGLTGRYRSVRHARSSVDEVLIWIGIAPELSVEERRNGTLLLGGARYVELEPDLYRRVPSEDGPRLPAEFDTVGIRRDEAGEARFVFVGDTAFGRLAWWQGLRVQGLFAGAHLVILLALLFWAVRRSPGRQSHLANRARLAAALTAIFDLAFVAGLVFLLRRWQPLVFAYGLPTSWKALLALPLLGGLTTLGMLLLAVPVLGHAPWTRRGRAFYVFGAVTAASFTLFLASWNLFGLPTG